MRTCSRNSPERSFSPIQEAKTDIRKSGGITHRQTYQRTKLTRLNSDNQESEFFRKVSSSVTLQNEFFDSDSQDILPGGFDTSFDRKTNGNVTCNAMAARPSQHSRYCCHFHQYPYPWWVYYITPVVQVSLVILCGFGMLNTFKHQTNITRSLDILSVNIHGIKMDIEDFAHNLKHTNDAQRRSDEQIQDIAMILAKLTHFTKNQTLQYRSEMELENSDLIALLRSAENIKDVVKREIGEYDADKTARSDYALESAGGQILSVLNTKPYTIHTGSIVSKTWSYLMRLFCNAADSARPILQPSVNPGQCWAFQGSRGVVLIKLLAKIYISGITLEHIPASISPTQEISSAPKTFSIWGFEEVTEVDGYFFGEFVYNKEGPSVQYFDVQYRTHRSYSIVQLKIHSNWGNSDYTCVYRLRVHGMLNKMYIKQSDKV